MQFFYDGKMYKAIRITGPKHNILGLSFTDTQENFCVEINDLEKNSVESNIDSSDVESQVMKAVSESNKEFNTTYRVKKIEFISSDAPSSNAYKELTKAIIRRLVLGKEFKKL